MSVCVCDCALRSLKEVAHLSVRLYFLLSLAVSCCRAGYVCGRHLKSVNNTKGMKEGFNLLLSVGQHEEVGVLLHPAIYFNGDKVNLGGGIFLLNLDHFYVMVSCLFWLNSLFKTLF